MNNNTFTISLIIVAIVFGGAGYFAGTAHGAGTTQSGAQGQGTFGAGGQGGTGQYGGRGFGGRTGAAGANGGGIVAGQILSKDAQGITISLPGGGSKIVLTSSSTSYTVMSSTTAANLAVGQTVMVNGTANSDGSITANQVRVGGGAVR